MTAGTPLRAGLTLAAFAALCTALVVGTHAITRDRIAANDKALLERSLQPVLGDRRFDGGIADSPLTVPPPHELPGSGPAVIYRVYLDGRPAAALFVVSARDGFAGPIRILLGIAADGTVTGMRVLDHRETPGLGDGIDIDRSDWARQFDGRSLRDPAVGGWAIRGDGGEFDQLTGASVTPRAVVGAVRDTLLYFEAHRDEIFE